VKRHDRQRGMERMARRAERAARQASDDDAELEVEPDGERRRAWWYYLTYGLIAVGLALGAYYTSGASSLVMAVLAGIFAAITLWSVLFMGVLEGVLNVIKHASSPPNDPSADAPRPRRP
jgi:hypothetical protein